MITFRHLAPDDLTALHRLEAEAYEPALHESDEAFLRLITLYPEGAFGFVDGAELCAYAFVLPMPAGAVLELQAPLSTLPSGADCLYIHDVAVSARHRGRGLGGRLVSAVKDLARARGFRACELVSVQGSAPFWERCGFERVAEFAYVPGIPAMKMRAVLGP